jgi:Tfp pilus assembly protein PilO
MKIMFESKKTILIFLLSWIGILFLGTAVLFKIPEFVKEKNNLEALYKQLNNQNALEQKMKTFVDRLKYETQSLKAQINVKLDQIKKKPFNCPDETEIGEFINELQLMFEANEVSIINLGYHERSIKDGLITMPFSIEFTADYQGMRKTLHVLETHKSGVCIDSLEFLSLNDSKHRIHLKASCSVRFSQIDS